MSQSAEILKEQFFQSLGLPWQEILPASRLNQILEEEGIQYRNRVHAGCDAMGDDLPGAISG